MGVPIYLSHETALFAANHIVSDAFLQPTKRSRLVVPKEHLDEREIARCKRLIYGPFVDDDTLAEVPLHYMAARSMKHTRGNGAFAHAISEGLTKQMFLELDDNVHVAIPELALVQASRSANMAARLLQAYELFGTYATSPNRCEYSTFAASSVGKTAEFCKKNKGVYGANSMIKLLKYCADGAASPMEAKLAILLALPTRYGGGGLALPKLNMPIQANAAAQDLTDKYEFRCDLCWPEHLLDVEYQSRQFHENPDNRQSDSRRSNALTSMGYQVYSVTFDQIANSRALNSLVDSLRHRCKLRTRTTVADIEWRREQLKRDLKLIR